MCNTGAICSPRFRVATMVLCCIAQRCDKLIDTVCVLLHGLKSQWLKQRCCISLLSGRDISYIGTGTSIHFDESCTVTVLLAMAPIES